MRRIAVVMAGGVSLGSFEAGAVTELLYALETLNQGRAEQDRLRLDVMTGGSAGGMTAALVARIMMYDLPGRRSHLFSAWVKDIRIDRLLQRAPENAILSKDVIDEIADKYLLGGSFQAVSPASFAPKTLRLGLSLSNMHGIEYRLPTRSQDRPANFEATRFADFARFTLQSGALSGVDEWSQIKKAAVACGNFPMAFQPQTVRRDAADYPGSLQAATNGFFPRDLAFVDGGMFDNEPLCEAIHLAAAADDGIVDPSRLFLLVDPHINRSAHVPSIDSAYPLLRTLGRLYEMLWGEAAATDWVRAQAANVQLQWRDQFLEDLASLIETNALGSTPQLIAQLDHLIAGIAEALNAAQPGRYSNPATYIDGSLDQIEKQQSQAYQKLGAVGVVQTDKQRVFERVVFILNHTGALQNKSPIHIELIGSDPDETAGDQIAGFAGFFNEEWREHDYRRGRIKAHGMLQSILDAYPREPGVPDYAIPADWKDLPTVTIDKADRNLREAARNRITDRVMELVKPHTGWWYRWIVRSIVSRKIGGVLKL